jgi:hypothetical protein
MAQGGRGGRRAGRAPTQTRAGPRGVGSPDAFSSQHRAGGRKSFGLGGRDRQCYEAGRTRAARPPAPCGLALSELGSGNGTPWVCIYKPAVQAAVQPRDAPSPGLPDSGCGRRQPDQAPTRPGVRHPSSTPAATLLAALLHWQRSAVWLAAFSPSSSLLPQERPPPPAAKLPLVSSASLPPTPPDRRPVISRVRKLPGRAKPGRPSKTKTKKRQCSRRFWILLRDPDFASTSLQNLKTIPRLNGTKSSQNS